MLMQTSGFVDFSAVEEKHDKIDARLQNWARWANNRTGNGTSPMFRLYRSTEVHAGHESTAPAVDALDAQTVQKAVSQLPTKHRLALSWAYITRTNPRKAAQGLGLSLSGLAEIVRDSRQMLCNRGC
jgi:DNA-directed RNA polymerase specialized sigma24 family protein